MRINSERLDVLRILRSAVALLCALVLIPGDASMWAFPQDQAQTEKSAKLGNEQLESLVAPIALYPDPLLSQTLVASTYPLEIIQLQQWLAKNKNLKDKALSDAVMKQDWDPSVQSMAAFPDLVKQLSENIKWTTDLGNAFLAQQNDVMDAVQRMRKKAQDKGTLTSTEQQKVETKTVESKQVIVIEPAKTEVVYVPSYNPTVVYGDPYPSYPYPPVAYPPAGYYAAGMAISFGVGMMVGAAWGGGWGYGCGWGGNNNVYINNNNNFINNSNKVSGGNRVNAGNSNRSNWQHNPQHRGGAPYGDRATANKFSGTTRGDSLSNRQASARTSQARDANRGGDFQRTSDRTGGGDRGGARAGTMDRGAGGGGDRVGNRSVGGSDRGGGGSAFGGGGGGGGMSGSSARASSSRGSSSFGGGGSRGGGGRSGGGGGGRRR